MRESHCSALIKAIKNSVFLASVFEVASSSQNGPAFRSDVEVVAIPCTVVDAHGVAVGGLTGDEFRVYDNGVRWNIENLLARHGSAADAGGHHRCQREPARTACGAPPDGLGAVRTNPAAGRPRVCHIRGRGYPVVGRSDMAGTTAQTVPWDLIRLASIRSSQTTLPWMLLRRSAQDPPPSGRS